MAIDTKYGRVTTEHGEIDDDEPVVVFRARDRHLQRVLDNYRWWCAEDSPEHHLDAIDRARDQVAEWQDRNPELVRTPNSDAYYERTKGSSS